MKIRSINPTNINKLRNAFYDELLEEGIRFDTIGLVEEGEQLVLFFEDKQKDTASVIKFEKEGCIGYEPAFIAHEIMKPIIEDIKKKKDQSLH